MTTVLVTGATGYLGGRLAQYLAAMPEVDLHVAVRDPQKLHFLKGSRYQSHLLVPSTSTQDLSALVEAADVVVHLLAANAKTSNERPEEALDVTVGLTVRLLAAAKAAGVKRFIYLSTIHIYGPLQGHLTEETLPQPKHPYAITHRAAEDFVVAANDRMESVIFRLSNALGPPASKETDCWMLAANDFCREAVIKGTITLQSNGSGRRDFIGMRDVLSILSSSITGNPLSYQIINFASGVSISIKELASLVAERSMVLFGKLVTISYQKQGSTFEVPFQIANDRLRKSGFRPSFDLTSEIDDTLRFCAQHFS